MSTGILRRTVLCTLVIALLLPMANAFAVPMERNGSGATVPQTQDWSRMIFRSVDGLLSFFERVTKAVVTQVGNDPKNSEGNGIDPHGGPKP